jgi:hypothetical protein
MVALNRVASYTASPVCDQKGLASTRAQRRWKTTAATSKSFLQAAFLFNFNAQQRAPNTYLLYVTNDNEIPLSL